MTGGYVNTLRRIVESPFEFYVRRIGVHNALNLCRLMFRDAIYTGLVRCTCWCIYKEKQERIRIGRRPQLVSLAERSNNDERGVQSAESFAVVNQRDVAEWMGYTE